MPVPGMVRVMREVDYRSFQDGSRFAVVRGISLLATLGMHKGDGLAARALTPAGCGRR
jgi:NTE family protein